jgi:hypothetical protein
VRVVYFVKADAASIDLREIETGDVARTVVAEGFDLDFDHEGRLVSIGIDGQASRFLPSELLASAERR